MRVYTRAAQHVCGLQVHVHTPVECRLCTGFNFWIDNRDTALGPIAYCFKGHGDSGTRQGCNRAYFADGGPGVCNAAQQKKCFWPADFDCRCTTDRSSIPGQARLRCTCISTRFNEAVQREQAAVAAKAAAEKVAAKERVAAKRAAAKTERDARVSLEDVVAVASLAAAAECDVQVEALAGDVDAEDKELFLAVAEDLKLMPCLTVAWAKIGMEAALAAIKKRCVQLCPPTGWLQWVCTPARSSVHARGVACVSDCELSNLTTCTCLCALQEG